MKFVVIYLSKFACYCEVCTRVSLLENGPPVGYPLQFRVSGEDLAQVRQWAQQVAANISANPNSTNVHLDWASRAKSFNCRLIKTVPVKWECLV